MTHCFYHSKSFKFIQLTYLSAIRMACLSVILLVGCSKPLSVKREVLMPARVDGLKQSKKIAFTSFKGDSTGLYTQKIENYFRQVKVDNKPYFEVIERDALEKIIAEQKLSQSGLLDEAESINVGHISGADTLVLGSIAPPVVESIRTYEQRTDFNTCLRYIKIKNRLVCDAFRTYQVDCFTQSTSIEFNIKFVNIETAKSNYQGNYSGSSEHYYCSDRGSRLSQERLKDIAFTQSINSMRKDIAPYRKQVTIVMLDEDDGSNLEDNDSALELFKKGFEMVDNGNVDRGCTFFRQASAKYAHSPAIYYNLGVCTELKAHLPQALTFYQAAQNKIGDKPLPEIPRAIKRIKQRMVDDQRVKQQSR